MIRHGKDLKIESQTSGFVIALAKSCEIETDCEELEVSSPYSGDWRDFIGGRKSWQVTVNYLVKSGSVASDLLRTGNIVSLKVKDGETGTPLAGNALVKNCKEVGTMGNLSTGAFQFIGCGELAVVSGS